MEAGTAEGLGTDFQNTFHSRSLPLWRPFSTFCRISRVLQNSGVGVTLTVVDRYCVLDRNVECSRVQL